MQLPPFVPPPAARTGPSPIRFGASILVLLLFALAGLPSRAHAQEPVVSGDVVSGKSLQPIQGAVITMVGSTERVVTDVRGRFRLALPAGAGSATITVAMVGFQPVTKVVTAGDQSVRIILAESRVELEELVVTGTVAATQKRTIGNAVAQVRVSEEVEVAPIQTVDELLNARASGVVLVPPSGLVGGGARIFIRGRSSISLPTDPLVYVDGVRVDNRAPLSANPGGPNGVGSGLNDFSPEEIESIEVIKGPAASTLYGTEANNGVIQIITKRGKPGAAKIDVSIREGTNFIMNPAGRWLLNYYQDTNGQYQPFNLYQVEADAGRPLFRTGLGQGYAVNVSGGSELIKYFASGNYSHDEGAMPGNQAQRYGGRINLDVTPHPKYDVSGSFGFSLARNTYPDGSNSLLFDAILNRPENRDGPTRGFYTAPSEVWNREFSFDESVDRLTAGVEARHRPTDWLTHRLRVGVDLANNSTSDLTKRMSPEDAQFFAANLAAGQKTVTQNNGLHTTLDYSASVTKSFWSSFRSVTSAGFQSFRRRASLLTATGQQFPSSDVVSISGAAIQRGSEDVVENITAGGFIQEQISIGDRFFLTGAIRRDRNSAFGKSFGAVTYPKVSASWVVSEEPFWKVPLVNTFRLRAAWGKSGEQPDAFASLRTYEPITGQAGLPAVSPQFVGNSSLGPEKGEELELGFEMGLLNQRLNLDFTYYNKTTNDAIVARNVAPSTGFPQQQFVNAGQVKNKGFELAANARVIESKRVAWDLSLNISHNSNKVTQLGIPNTPYLEFGFGNRFQPGYPVYAFFARRVISAERGPNGDIINIQCDGGLPDGMPGGAPVDCATAPRVYRGQPEPAWEGSVASTLTLGGRLTFSVMVDFKRDFVTWDSNLWCPGILTCESEAFPDRVSPVVAASNALGLTDDFAWEPDLSFAKLREVSISFAMPDHWAKVFGAKRAMVTVAGRNLHTWTSYKGLDPENFSAFPEANPGFATPFSQNQLPQAAQFMLRFNFTF